jgi:hypothetical protein
VKEWTSGKDVGETWMTDGERERMKVKVGRKKFRVKTIHI